MKIEKISERQIRCTLSKKDLLDRELRLSELAYGTEKAKELFRDMMQQASYEFGFEADDIPLMIEAIPVSSECLVLVVTKVEDPEELDTRFSKFTDDVSEDYSEEDDDDDSYQGDEEVLNCFGKLDDLIDSDEDVEDDDSFVPLPKAIGSEEYNMLENLDENKTQNTDTDTEAESRVKRVYSFDTLEDVIRASSIIVSYFKGESCLYKNPSSSKYFLSITKFDNKKEDFNRVCGIISEYGKLERTTYASMYYYNEHYRMIVSDDAINILSKM